MTMHPGLTELGLTTKPSCAGAAHCTPQASKAHLQRPAFAAPRAAGVCARTQSHDLCFPCFLTAQAHVCFQRCQDLPDKLVSMRKADVWAGLAGAAPAIHPGRHVGVHALASLMVHHHRIVLCTAAVRAKTARCAAHERRFETVVGLLTESADACRRASRPGHCQTGVRGAPGTCTSRCLC